jgi:hypothetical protein
MAAPVTGLVVWESLLRGTVPPLSLVSRSSLGGSGSTSGKLSRAPSLRGAGERRKEERRRCEKQPPLGQKR